MAKENLSDENLDVTASIPVLSRTSLIRSVYRNLLNRGRSYAAFTEKEKELLTLLSDKSEIFDPTSGYGSLMKYCAKVGLNSYCLEYNVPQYLWQVLNNPLLSLYFINSCKSILNKISELPYTKLRAVASDDWFSLEAEKLLFDILDFINEFVFKEFPLNELEEIQSNELSLALLLPFVGRMSCSVRGDVVTHVKKGGICVFNGWQDDFKLYLEFLIAYLKRIEKEYKNSKHTIVQGDVKTFNFPKKRFGSLLTSPPYPNHRDFVSMFAPENHFLDILSKRENKIYKGIFRSEHDKIIGSNFVRNRITESPESKSVSEFINKINALNRNSTAISHDNQYYIPYFQNYFSDLEKAYKNTETALKDTFEGYIIVVDNTHRNLIIPVAQAVIEIWKSLNCKAEVFEYRETFHVGAKNPRAKGHRAKHTEYIIKVWR